MAEDTTESDKPNEPKKTQTRKRTTAAGLVLSGMSTMLDVAAQAAARAESMQKMVDSLMPFERPTPDGMDLLVGIPAYRKLDAIAAEAAAQVDPDQPASDRGPGETSSPLVHGTPGAADQVTGEPPTYIRQWPIEADDPRLLQINPEGNRPIVARYNRVEPERSAKEIGTDVNLSAGRIYNIIADVRRDHPDLVRPRRNNRCVSTT